MMIRINLADGFLLLFLLQCESKVLGLDNVQEKKYLTDITDAALSIQKLKKHETSQYKSRI